MRHQPPVKGILKIYMNAGTGKIHRQPQETLRIAVAKHTIFHHIRVIFRYNYRKAIKDKSLLLLQAENIPNPFGVKNPGP